MSTFKDCLESDLDVFFDLDEFTETHNINDTDMLILIDDDLLKERQTKTNTSLADPGGLYGAEVLFQVKKAEFGEKPQPEEILELDGKIYRVVDVEENHGVYIITLGANNL